MKNLILVIAACLGLALSAARAQTPDPNHTVVRFTVLAGGTNFGQLDIELFDQEKPETVRNFLLYIYSGSYSNLVIQRIVTNLVLQAGHIQIADPTDTNTFDTYPIWNDFGRITNEFSVGPRLPNDFGTIALARLSGQTNSGSFDWFINLGDNPVLDTTDGGFTVFGRVVNSAGPRSGTNLLNHFNTFVRGVHTRFMFFFDYNDFQTDFPVTTNRNEELPMFTELFVLRPSFLQGGQPRDTVLPTIQINQPADAPVIAYSNPAPLAVSGTAGDNQRVARVLYDVRLDGGLISRSTVASGRENWAANVDLEYGTNQVSVQSVDDFGNLSTPDERTVYFPFRRVNLRVFGKGKVTGITNGQYFLVGTTNRLTVMPAPRWFFLDWRGAVNSASRTVDFVVQPDSREIDVVFSRTFLGLSNGPYQGLLLPLSNAPPRSAGFISLNLNPTGEYFGRLAPLGANYQIHAKFENDATSRLTGARGLDLLQLLLVLFPNQTIQGNYFDGHFPSSVTMGRVQKFSRTSPTPHAGAYTFLISPPTNATLRAGHGSGTVTIDALGKIKMNGTLADGVTVRNNGAALLVGGIWTFLGSANGGREAVLGFVSFAANRSFSSDAIWFAPDFPGNTNQGVKIWGSPYTPPSQGPLFNWTNGRITLTGNGLAAPVSTDLVLNGNGTFTLPSNPHNIQLALAAPTGVITGSLNHPDSGALTPLRGAVLQSSNIAAGFFGTGTNAGGFVIRAQ